LEKLKKSQTVTLVIYSFFPVRYTCPDAEAVLFSFFYTGTEITFIFQACPFMGMTGGREANLMKVAFERTVILYF